MEEFKKIYHSFNCEFYKIEDNNTPNNFVLYNKSNNIFQTEISLINIFDILKDKHLDIMFELFINEKIDNKKLRIKPKTNHDKTNIMDKISKSSHNHQVQLQIKELENFKNSSDDEKKLILINNQKESFRLFKNIVLLYKININGFEIIPNNKKIINRNGEKYLNIYRPLIDIDKIEIKLDREFSHIERLLKNILNEGYEFFLKFLAWKIQHPLNTIANHWIIQDDGGTGKTEILANEILYNIFNCSIIGQDELQSPYTDYLINKTFIIAEEIEGFSNEKKV